MAQLDAARSAVECVDGLTGADARRARKLRLDLRAIPVDGPSIVGDEARKARKLRQKLMDTAVKKDECATETGRLAKIAEAAAKRRERIARRQANEERLLLGLDEHSTPQASPGASASPAPDASPVPEASPSSAADDERADSGVAGLAELRADAAAEFGKPKVIRRIVDESISSDIAAAKVLDEALAREAREDARRRFDLDKSMLNNIELWNKPPPKKQKKKDKKDKKKEKKRKRSSSSDPGSDSQARSGLRSLDRQRSLSKSRSRSRSKSRSRSRGTTDDR